MKIPDLISTIKAYRTWQWDAEGIASLNNERWIPGEALAATCVAYTLHLDGEILPNHKSPDPKCTCGVYAAKDFKHLVKIGYADHGIHGEVELWGTVMEHRLGFRAQFAYPKSFTVPEDMLPYQMSEIESRLSMLSLYGVPIYYALRNPVQMLLTKSLRPSEFYEDLRLLLWDKENGFSAAGVETLSARARTWYEHTKEKNEVQVGDRVAIKDAGIAIVHALIDEKRVRLQLFNRMLVEAHRENIVWSVRNNRWETDQTGYTITRVYPRPKRMLDGGDRTYNEKHS